MTYVITDACVDVLDRSCMEECPVDCIYEGAHKAYINPVECIDCGACMEVCPSNAAVTAASLRGTEREWHVEDNRLFFTLLLPGRDAPLGDPGGASAVGRIGADTPAVAANYNKESL